MEIRVEQVDGVNRGTIPKDGETIADDFNLDELLSVVKSIHTYQRDKIACPFARGNWILDLHLVDGKIYSIKLPIEMTENHFIKWCEPLIEKFKAIQSSKMH